MLEFLIIAAIAGFVVYFVTSFVPMPPAFRTAIIAIAVIGLILYGLDFFGVTHFGSGRWG